MSPRSVSARLPVGPLLERTGSHQVVRRSDGSAGGLAPVTTLARLVRVSPRTVHRWLDEGGVPFYTADIAAHHLGCHPFDVWGCEWWEASSEQDDLDQVILGAEEADWRARAELVGEMNRVERAAGWSHRCAFDGCRCGAGQ